MKKKFIFIFFLLILISCKKDIKLPDPINKIASKENTVINFIDKPKDTMHSKSGSKTRFSSVVHIINNSGFENEIQINKTPFLFNFKPQDELFFIRHVYRMENVYFELKKGDSITYFEKDDFPTYKGNDSLLNLSNQYESIRKKFLNIPYPNNILVFARRYFGLKKKASEIISNYNKYKNLYIKKELYLLDSLFKEKKITENRYSLQKEKLHFEQKDIKNIKEDELLNYLNRVDLLKFKFYRDWLDRYSKHHFKIKLQKSSNKAYFDLRILFDSVYDSNLFHKKTKKYILFNNLSQIGATYSFKDYNLYYNKFTKLYKDSTLTKELNKKYLGKTITKNELKQTYLVNRQKEEMDLEAIIKENKGKLIYVDFWASWCAPCRAAMPASKILANDYKNKDIALVYISIDKDFEKWEKATKDEKLVGKNTLLAINYPDANFYKELKLETIPRYLLYNKEGKLIHQNAPSPDTKEIRTLFEKYLKE